MHPRQVISLKPHPFSTSLDESLSFSASSDGTRLISGVTRVHDTREWRGVVAVALGFFRAPFWAVLALMALGKFGRYAALALPWIL